MTEFKDLIHIKDWVEANDAPVIIAGPCSAESEEQVLKTAAKLLEIGKVNIFRAGIWKPRTRPGTFEGVGKKGLKWLNKVKKEYNLPVAIEVAHPEHIELALKYQVDIVWIGARTIANPFSVQQLAEKLRGTDLPVMVKNPVNPDLSAWIGALERFYHSGVRKLAAVHRGFYPFEITPLRNIPKWEIPIELKVKYENLPIICDPSHISGHIDYIEEISQKALDLNMDGLMIEAHINPTEALSDAVQQLVPEDLKKLISNLVFRKKTSDDKEFQDLLQTLREQIDAIDVQIIELMAQRIGAVEKIGEYKSKTKVAILQLQRWENILNTRLQLGKKLGLSEEFLRKMLQLIHKESIQKQTEVMNKSGGKK